MGSIPFGCQGLQQPPRTVPWLCPASGHPTAMPTSQALLQQVMSFTFSATSPPVAAPLSLQVPTATPISFSTHNVGGIHKKLLESGCGTCHHLCAHPEEVFVALVRSIILLAPLTSLPRADATAQLPFLTFQRSQPKKLKHIGVLGEKGSSSSCSLRKQIQELFMHCAAPDGCCSPLQHRHQFWPQENLL